MILKVKIIKATKKPFPSSEGGMINWTWYKAEKLADGVSIDLGSRRDYDIGQEVTVDAIKEELTNGKYRYKEQVPADVVPAAG